MIIGDKFVQTHVTDKRKSNTSIFVLNSCFVGRCVDINVTNDIPNLLLLLNVVSTFDFSTDGIDTKPVLQNIHHNDDGRYSTHSADGHSRKRFSNDSTSDDLTGCVLAVTTPGTIAKAFARITAVQ